MIKKKKKKKTELYFINKYSKARGYGRMLWNIIMLFPWVPKTMLLFISSDFFLIKEN